MTKRPKRPDWPIQHVVKRYAGTRLYDTTTLAYVTGDELRALVKADTEVVVYEAEDGSDITQRISSDA